MSEYSNQACLNCHQQLPLQATFCPNCGQKSTTGLISLQEFLNNFVDTVFNIDSRIVQTLKWLCVPAKLTQEYFKGKHRTYYHPIRLYLVLSILFFAILNFMQGEDSMVNVDLDEEVDLNKLAAREEGRLATLRQIDSFQQKTADYYTNRQVNLAIDSLRKILENPPNRDSFEITLAGKDLKIDPLDAANLSGKELADKYEVEGFWGRILLRQIAHFLHDQAALSRQIFNNFPLMLLAMMPFLALFLKLLYIRQKRFYVEHLVLNFHHHAFMFFLFSILFLLPEDWFEIIIPAGFVATLLFLFLAMKYYYGQGFFKTLIKYLLFNFFYLLSFIVVLAVTFIISFLLF